MGDHKVRKGKNRVPLAEIKRIHVLVNNGLMMQYSSNVISATRGGTVDVYH